MKKLLCVLIVFVVFGCHNNAERRADVEMVGEVVAVNAPKKPDIARKLIQNGSISFEVANVTKTRKEIIQLTNDFGGYVASEKNHNYNERTKYEHVVRIPGNKLEEFTSKVEALAIHIEDRNFSVQDVTEEFVDLESRLTAKQELEARYREIVRQAKTIKEILEVEDQIGIVRSEIEAIQGKLKYLSNKTSFSTITLTYYQPFDPAIETPGIGSKFADAFLGGWDSLVSLAIGLTSAWPFLVIFSTGLWFLVRRLRKEDKQIAQPQ